MPRGAGVSLEQAAWVPEVGDDDVEGEFWTPDEAVAVAMAGSRLSGAGVIRLLVKAADPAARRRIAASGGEDEEDDEEEETGGRRYGGHGVREAAERAGRRGSEDSLGSRSSRGEGRGETAGGRPGRRSEHSETPTPTPPPRLRASASDVIVIEDTPTPTPTPSQGSDQAPPKRRRPSLDMPLRAPPPKRPPASLDRPLRAQPPKRPPPAAPAAAAPAPARRPVVATPPEGAAPIVPSAAAVSSMSKKTRRAALQAILDRQFLNAKRAGLDDDAARAWNNGWWATQISFAAGAVEGDAAKELAKAQLKVRRARAQEAAMAHGFQSPVTEAFLKPYKSPGAAGPGKG